MIANLGESLTALYGTLRLARFDAAGLQYLDTSPEGFWKSFTAALWILPIYLPLTALNYGFERAPLSGHVVALEVLGYVIAWTAFPVVMLSVTRLFQRRQHFIRYIVAYNWASVWQIALYGAVSLLTEIGVLRGAVGDFIGLAAFGAILFYGWFVARAALDIPAPTAAGVVALDLTLALIIEKATTLAA